MTTGQLFMLCFAACLALLFAVWGIYEWAWRRGRRRYDRAVSAARDGYLRAQQERDEQLRADLERRFAEDWRAGRVIFGFDGSKDETVAVWRRH